MKKSHALRIENLADCQEHLPVVCEWMWHQWENGDEKARKVVEYRTRHCLNKKILPMTFIGLIGDEPVGTVSLWTTDLDSRQDLTPWLSVLYVAPNKRGLGIGTTLQKYATNQARDLGFEKLYLTTDHVGYYEKTGWSFLEMAPVRLGADTRIYIHQLNL